MPEVEVMRNCRSEVVARIVKVRRRPRAASLEVHLSITLDESTSLNDGPTLICAVQLCVLPAAVNSQVTEVRLVPVMPGKEMPNVLVFVPEKSWLSNISRPPPYQANSSLSMAA